MTDVFLDPEELPPGWDSTFAFEVDELDDRNWELFDPENADEIDPTVVVVEEDD